MGPNELGEVVEYVRSQRVNESPFDVAVEGMSQDPEGLGRLVVGYERVGLTWWIEKLGWWRGPVEEALHRIRAGPPG